MAQAGCRGSPVYTRLCRGRDFRGVAQGATFGHLQRSPHLKTSSRHNLTIPPSCSARRRKTAIVKSSGTRPQITNAVPTLLLPAESHMRQAGAVGPCPTTLHSPTAAGGQRPMRCPCCCTDSWNLNYTHPPPCGPRQHAECAVFVDFRKRTPHVAPEWRPNAVTETVPSFRRFPDHLPTHRPR